MSSESEAPRRKLPQVWRHAFWHLHSGLVVSPLSRTLPSAVVSSPESTRIDDFSKPRLLSDENIYLAFYPRKPIHRGPLFSVLAISPEDLEKSILPIEGGPPDMYILDQSIGTRWSNLETSLLEVVYTLYSVHPQNRNFPTLVYPRWPHEYGYRNSFKTKELTLHCARKSLTAFNMLTAFTTFVLSLWLTEYEDDCLAEAFATLTQRNRDALPRVWLQYLKESIVSNFSAGLRPGAFLNPYTTYWGAFLVKFTRASVPIWLMWGKEHAWSNPTTDRGIKFYFPPEKYIQLAKGQNLTFSDPILPHQHTYRHIEGQDDDMLAFASTIPFAHSPYLPTGEGSLDDGFGLHGFDINNADAFVNNDNPDEPPPPAPAIDRRTCVDPGSSQRIGESWEDFFERQMVRLRRRMEHENEKDRRSREDLEKQSKSGPTKKSTVFIWVQDTILKTFYRRTRVDKEIALFEWKACTAQQRFFWPHINQWDLCPQLPAYSNREAPDSDSDNDTDGDKGPEYPSMETRSKLVKPSVVVGPLMLQTVRDITAREPEAEDMGYHYVPGTLLEYLRRRHGFVADLVESWNPHLHPDISFRLLQSQSVLAIKNLLHVPSDVSHPPSVETSIVDFYNTALGSQTSYIRLPAVWDISRYRQVTFHCEMQRIRLQRVHSVSHNESELYVLRPPAGSPDPSPWFVAIRSATAVLLVYRSTWTTMHEIGRGLLELGIPFRTVVERDHQSVGELLRSKTKGLGSRPKRFQPTQEDFSAYETARDDILRSSYGRSIRLLGGIVGRLAAEVVPDHDVLDGPGLVRVEVVGRHGPKDFVDDAVGNEQLDIVSGVYLVDAGTSSSTASHSSWWPKHHTWEASGLASDQWLPAAEEWYQKRLSNIRDDKLKLQNATEWKQNLKLRRPQTSAVLAGSERLAAEFIRKSSRVH